MARGSNLYANSATKKKRDERKRRQSNSKTNRTGTVRRGVDSEDVQKSMYSGRSTQTTGSKSTGQSTKPVTLSDRDNQPDLLRPWTVDIRPGSNTSKGTTAPKDNKPASSTTTAKTNGATKPYGEDPHTAKFVEPKKTAGKDPHSVKFVTKGKTAETKPADTKSDPHTSKSLTQKEMTDRKQPRADKDPHSAKFLSDDDMKQKTWNDIAKETYKELITEDKHFSRQTQEAQDLQFAERFYEKLEADAEKRKQVADEKRGTAQKVVSNPFVQWGMNMAKTGVPGMEEKLKEAEKVVLDDYNQLKYDEAIGYLDAIKSEKATVTSAFKQQSYNSDMERDTDKDLYIKIGQTQTPNAKGFDSDLHKYINDIDGRASKNNMVNFLRATGKTEDSGGYGRPKYIEYLTMTPEEKTLYNYYVGKGKYGQAEDYLKTIHPELNKRYMLWQEGMWNETSAENPVPTSVLSAFMTLGEGAGYVESLIQKVAGNDVDPYAPYFNMTSSKGAIREGVKTQIESEFGRKTYDIGMSIADNVVNLAASGGVAPVSLTLMSTSAAANTTRDAKLRGATDEQALGLGAIAGAIEALTEKVPLDNVLKLARGKGSKAILDILKQSGIEATEETMAEIANIIADEAIMGDMSNYNATIRTLMAEGYSYSDALKVANQEITGNIIDAAIGGAVSGGVLGGGGSLIGNVRNSIQNSNNISSINNAYVQAGVNDALNNPAVLRTQTSDTQVQTAIQNAESKPTPMLDAINGADSVLESKAETEVKRQQQGRPMDVTTPMNATENNAGNPLVPYSQQEAFYTPSSQEFDYIRKDFGNSELDNGGYPDDISTYTPRQINETLKSFGEYVIRSGDQTAMIRIGSIPPRLAQDIGNINGQDISGYDDYIYGNGILHGIKHNAETGNIPLTQEDISMIPEIINEYDDIAITKKRNGQTSIKLTKNIGDNFTYVALLGNKRGWLFTKDMWKTENKNGPSRRTDTTAISSKDAAYIEPSFSNTTIPQNGQNVNDTEAFNIEQLGRDNNALRSLYQNLVSAQEPLEAIGKYQNRQGEVATVNDTTQIVRQAGGSTDYILESGLVDMHGNQLGESFVDMIDNIPESDLSAYNTYAQHLHNIDRARQGKPVFPKITAEQSAERVATIEKTHPEFREYANMINDWWDLFGQAWMVESGLISQEGYNVMRGMYPNYIPTYRRGKNQRGTGGIYGNRVTPGKAIGKAEGGNGVVIPLENQFVDQINRIVRTARNNQLYSEMYQLAFSDPQAAAEYGVMIAQPETGVLQGDPDTIAANAEAQSIKQDKTKETDNGKYQATAYINGEPQAMYLSKDVYEALNRLRTNITDDAIGSAANMLRKISGVSKQFITGINPVFVATNIVRDLQTYLMNTGTKNPFRAVSNLFKAYGQIIKNGDTYNQFKALGGDRSGYYGNIARDASGEITSMPKTFSEKGVGGKIGDVVKAPFELINKIGQVTEQAPRLAEYIGTIQRLGDTPAGRRAASAAAADITVNFSRSAPVTKLIDSFTLYLNAGVQGFDKMARQLKSHPIQTLGRGALYMVLPSILLALVNRDNDNYDELDQRTKDTYFLIPNMNDVDENGNARTFIKIPRSREYGALLGALTDRFFAAAESGDLGKEMEGYAETVMDNILPPMPWRDSYIQPLLNLETNKDFAGRTIVPESMQSLEPKYQMDIKTSGAAAILGDALNASPKQIDYLLSSFGGYPAKLLQGLTSQQVSGTEERLAKGLLEPFERAFTADPRYSSALTDELYNKKSEMETVKKTASHTGEPNTDAEEQYKILNNAATMLSDMRKYELQIMASDYTGEQKTSAVNNLREQMNDIARNALSFVGEREQTQNATMPEILVPIERETRNDGTETKNVTNAMSYGIPAGDFYLYDKALGGMESDKDAEGKTISNTKSLKQKDYIDSLSLNDEQKEYMYDAYQIGKKVRSGEATWDTVGVTSGTSSGDPAKDAFIALQKGEGAELEEGMLVSDISGIDYSKIPSAPMIQGAENEEVSYGRMSDNTYNRLAQYGINPQDYKYAETRISAYPDKVDYLVGLGFNDKQLTGMVEGLVMGDTAKGKMIVAQEDYGIDNDTYIGTYITGYQSVGTKAERNEQIRAYVDSLPGLSGEQKDALYEWNKVSKGKNATGEGQTSGGSGGSRKGRSGRRKSSAKAAEPYWETVPSLEQYLKMNQTVFGKPGGWEAPKSKSESGGSTVTVKPETYLLKSPNRIKQAAEQEQNAGLDLLIPYLGVAEVRRLKQLRKRSS